MNVPVTKYASGALDTKLDLIKPEGCSNLQAVCNIVMTAVGVGVLALPNAVANAGWVAGVGILILAWGLTHFMMCLLWKCLFMSPNGEKFDSYEAIGKTCFGLPGQIAVCICLYGGVGSICSLMIILMGQTMHNLIPNLSPLSWMVLFVVCMLPLCWLPSLKEIGLVSTLGVVATLVAVVFIIVAGIREAGSDRVHEQRLFPTSVGGLGLAFTNFMNSFTCAPVVPSLVGDMKDPRAFPKVALMSFTAITLVFGSIGFAGYAGWGIDMLTFDSIVEAVDFTAGEGDMVNVTVQVSIALVSTSHLLVLFAPLGKGAESAAQAVTGKDTLPLAVRLLVRTLALGICLSVAILVPGFGSLFNLVGSTVVMFLQIIFPTVFFIWLARLGAKQGLPDAYESKTQKKVYMIILPLCLALAAFGLILGTYQGIVPLLA